MGANEKHADTYHGVSHNPDTDLVRTVYAGASPVPSYEDRETAFNCWLETVRAEAKAEALNEVANAFQYKAWNELIQGSLQDRLRVAQPITAWLRARANQDKEGADNGR